MKHVCSYLDKVPEWYQLSYGGGVYRTVRTNDHDLCGLHEYLVNEAPHTGG